MTKTEERVLTTRECAEFLNVPHKTVQGYWRKWGLPGRKVGKRIQFRERDLEKWLD